MLSVLVCIIYSSRSGLFSAQKYFRFRSPLCVLQMVASNHKIATKIKPLSFYDCLSATLGLWPSVFYLEMYASPPPPLPSPPACSFC